MKSLTGAIMAAAMLSQIAPIHAQTTFVDWGQTWNYMHPNTGVLPAGSGATTPHSGATPWYAPEADFNANYSGPSFSAAGAGFDAGANAAPIGYGDIDYFDDPGPPAPEFSSFGTTLTTPASGSRYASYFRTTFTVPDDGNIYNMPMLRYLIDDGAFVYLDGTLVLRVNVGAAAADNYQTFASNTTDTESLIREADLSLPAGSATANANVVESVTALAPGEHTLAVSVRSNNATSSDMILAVQLIATPSSCALAATPGNVTRDLNGTPSDPSDDTVSFTINVTPTGAVGAGWAVTAPAASAALGQTGSYSIDAPITNIPIAEFASGSLTLTVGDAGSPNACPVEVSAPPQRIIATNDLAGDNLPIVTVGIIDSSGWVFDDASRTMTMNNPGGAARFVVTSEEIDLSGVAQDVQFSGELEIVDTSSGTEADDSFVAYLILDGDTGNPINLITPHDVDVVDGVLTDGELAPGVGTYTRDLSFLIPASANTAQIVIEGINNSDNETFIVRGLSFAVGDPELQAQLAGVVTFDNQGTADPSDDTISAPINITAVNLGASTGWSSNSSPAAGLYADAQPVEFGPLPASSSPITVTITDSLDAAETADVILTAPTPTIAISAPTNIVRIENGPGFDDDTVTFDVDISGADGGIGWTTEAAGVTPASGSYGTVSFTIAAPLPAGTLDLVIADGSYPAVTGSASVPIPGRYLIGQSDLGGSLENVETDFANPPDPQWENPSDGTLELNGGGTVDRVVMSEVLDLSAASEVYFSASLRAAETSTGSNFETGDMVKVELVYTVGGSPTTVNLISPFDSGDGAPSAGANGPANGFLNGFQGVADDTVDPPITVADDYNANRERDEFNVGSLPASGLVDHTFPLAAVIPAAATDVQLVVTGQGAGGSERFYLTDVLFSTSDALIDSDGDGIPNGYEDANGLLKGDPSDRDLDRDGDGQSNIEEYLAGTAADDSSSVLKVVSFEVVGDDATITWSSVPGKTYRIEGGDNLSGWTDFGIDFPAAADPATETTAGPVDLTQFGIFTEFFVRIRVLNN